MFLKKFRNKKIYQKKILEQKFSQKLFETFSTNLKKF
jgi:hypothetical protein